MRQRAGTTAHLRKTHELQSGLPHSDKAVDELSRPLGLLPPSPGSLLQKADRTGDFLFLGVESGGAGAHFWHDVVLDANIITPAKWMLSDAL